MWENNKDQCDTCLQDLILQDYSGEDQDLVRDLLGQSDGHVAQHALGAGIGNVLESVLQNQSLIVSRLVYLEDKQEVTSALEEIRQPEEGLISLMNNFSHLVHGPFSKRKEIENFKLSRKNILTNEFSNKAT